MISLVTECALTDHAQLHRDAFWRWVQAREPWFYASCDGLVVATHWLDFGDSVQHQADFLVAEAVDRYRELLARKRRDPSWEQRYNQQDQWYTITRTSLARTPRVPLGFLNPASAQLQMSAGGWTV